MVGTGNWACPGGVVLACGGWGPAGPGHPRSMLFLCVSDLHLRLLILSLGLLRRNGCGF